MSRSYESLLFYTCVAGERVIRVLILPRHNNILILRKRTTKSGYYFNKAEEFVCFFFRLNALIYRNYHQSDSKNSFRIFNISRILAEDYLT